VSHFIGQPYRYVSGLKDGSPVYEETIVVQAHADHLILSNGHRVEFVPVEFDLKGTPRS
jgi:hypothetical protein